MWQRYVLSKLIVTKKLSDISSTSWNVKGAT